MVYYHLIQCMIHVLLHTMHWYITLVENLQLNFSFNSSSIWSPILFFSEKTIISYHIYITNQLLHNDITEDTSYKLYNLTVCDIYIATVMAHSGEYSSSNVIIQREHILINI